MNAILKPTEIKNKDKIINSKVAVYINSASISLMIDFHAAAIIDLLSRGNKVTVYLCDRSFKSPMDNPFNRKSIDNYRMFRAKDAIKGLDVRLKIINLRNMSDKVSNKTAETLEIGTMSSFASILKAESKKDLSPKWMCAYNNMLESAKKLYNYFISEIKNEHYDFVFMFNGRFGCVRPALEATKDSNIGFGLYEIKKSLHEIVFINELIHSIEGNTRRALSCYEANKKEAEISAAKFFERKIESKNTGDPIYTKDQERGSLPEAIKNTTKKVIAVYPTTEDEYKFIGKEWDGYVPESQLDEMEKLAISLPQDEYIIVIKMHPNQIFSANNITEKYLLLGKKYPHVIIETPLSKKDTYALMNRADVVITFASTIGVEACYARKPVILIGDTNWGKMDIADKVYSGTEACELIKKGIKPKPILGAIIWGNYIYSYKDALPALSVAGRGNYFVNGRRIGRSVIRRILQIPARLEIHVSNPGFFLGTDFFLRTLETIVSMLRGR